MIKDTFQRVVAPLCEAGLYATIEHGQIVAAGTDEQWAKALSLPTPERQTMADQMRAIINAQLIGSPLAYVEVDMLRKWHATLAPTSTGVPKEPAKEE